MNSNVQSNAQKMGRHLAALLDRCALVVLPVVFGLYLILEVLGVFSGGLSLLGHNAGYSSPLSGRVKQMVEYYDMRSGEGKCYRNWPKDGPSKTLFKAAADQCGAAEKWRR
mmetsp:Transcript_47105/g.111023  ORF Transcript_47105/g.111023 Transcript_47105/m.111023 type:complete len:111 (-) Transcript_47105:1039-1371(-)